MIVRFRPVFFLRLAPSCSVKVGVLKYLEIQLVLIVGLEGDSVPEELPRELFRLELVPFVCRRPVSLILIEPYFVELGPLIDSLVRQDALVRFNAQLLAVRPVVLVLDEALELFVRFVVVFTTYVLQLLFKVALTIRARQRHRVGPGPQLPKVALDDFDRLLVVRQLLFLIAVVVAEVASVEHIVTQRVEVVRERLDVVRPDKPSFVLDAHLILHVLQVVVRWKVQLVTRGDVVVHQLSAILNHTESLVWVVLLASNWVNEVLLDVRGALGQLLLFFLEFLIRLFIPDQLRLSLAELPETHHPGIV